MMLKLRDKIDQHIKQCAPHILTRETSLLLMAARNMLTEQADNAAAGEAIQRAAKELPDGYELRIEIEKDAGSVEITVPEDDPFKQSEFGVDDFGSGDTFSDQINNAIDYAKEHSA
jgi:hypothetical protein